MPTCLALALAPLPAAAGEAGWTDAAAVAELRPTVHGRFLVRLPVTKNPSDCRAPEWFYRDHTGPGAERIYRLLLEATVRELPVRLHVTGVCDHDGRAGFNEAALVPD
jgi:hypothetical protein